MADQDCWRLDRAHNLDQALGMGTIRIMLLSSDDATASSFFPFTNGRYGLNKIDKEDAGASSLEKIWYGWYYLIPIC